MCSVLDYFTWKRTNLNNYIKIFPINELDDDQHEFALDQITIILLVCIFNSKLSKYNYNNIKEYYHWYCLFASNIKIVKKYKMEIMVVYSVNCYV